MVDPVFIPGYLGTVTVNSDDLSAVARVVSLETTRNIMTKPTFGSAYAFSLGGQKLGTFSAEGHIDTLKLQDIETAFNSDTPIAFSLQVGDAAAATDGGVYAGNCVLTSLTRSASADAEWDWAFSAQTSGAVTYTPPTP